MERWPYVDAIWRLDVLNGGTVNVGGVQVAGVSGAGKTAELVIAGKESRFTSGSSVSVGDYGNGVLSVIDGGSFSAGSNALIVGTSGSGSNRGALIIGSRGNMDTGTGLTEPTPHGGQRRYPRCEDGNQPAWRTVRQLCLLQPYRRKLPLQQHDER